MRRPTFGTFCPKEPGGGKLLNKHFCDSRVQQNFGVWPHPNCSPFLPRIRDNTGEQYKLISLVLKKLKKNYEASEIADMLEEDISLIQRIYDTAQKYAPNYDETKCAEPLEQMELA